MKNLIVGNFKKPVKREKEKLDTDEDVEKMLRAWDIVKCRICNKDISMLNATSVNSGEYFICRNRH
jgi:hypothetical protein